MSTTDQYHVFLSHHPDDESEAKEIARVLRDKHGIQPWLHAWSVIPGRLTQEEREKGLEQSDACAVLIGKGGVRELQRHDVDSSILKRVEAEGSNFPMIPVYLPDCPPEIEVPKRLKNFEPVAFAGLDDEEALRRLVCGIHGEPPGKELPADIPCPYPGLEPFREDMSKYFFGREDEIKKLEDLVKTGPLAVVIGPSGCGKSSLVLAGLISHLKGTKANPSPYLIRILKPGREPLQSLAMAFVPQPGKSDARNQLASAFAANERELSRVVQTELRQQPAHIRHMLFVVDQFEEVFTQCDDAAQRDAFIRNLLYACQENERAAIIVFTLRSDFLNPCFDYDQLIDRRYQLFLPRLRSERLRQAVERPARKAELHLQRGLVKTLLADAGDELGILPLIQYTLRELFEERNGRWLTIDAYHALGTEQDPTVGGVRGLIASRAETILKKLKANPKFQTEQVEPIVRRILLRLVQVSENSPPTRQEVDKHEFFWASDTDKQRKLLEEGLRLLLKERLLTSDKGRVNLAHEVIIKAWKRLAEWVNQNQQDLVTRREVEEAARKWERSGRDEDLLYRGSELKEALEWEKRRI